MQSTQEVSMRTTAAESDGLAHVRESARTFTTAAGRVPLEGWLAAGCVLTVLWAVGWV
jgi:hypothetical protein